MPYHPECAQSCLILEAKQGWACLVLGGLGGGRKSYLYLNILYCKIIGDRIKDF